MGKRQTRDSHSYPKDFEPDVWKFTEVTYENFENEYYKIVEAGEELPAQVSNTAELEEFYHKHFPY